MSQNPTVLASVAVRTALRSTALELGRRDKRYEAIANKLLTTEPIEADRWLLDSYARICQDMRLSGRYGWEFVDELRKEIFFNLEKFPPHWEQN